MSNKKLYNAMGKIDDNIIKDALEINTAGEKTRRLRHILEAAACAAIVCGFVVLSLVLQGLSKSDNNNIAASSGTGTELSTDTEEQVTTSAAAESTTEAESTEEPIHYITSIDPVDYDKLAEVVREVYAHEGTTATQFKLLDSFDTSEYTTWRSNIFRPDMYYDTAYDPEPIYSGNDTENPVWFKGPYVRYYVAGFPEYTDEEKFVTHVDICGDASVSVCGINIDSTFEEFTETFTALGFEVESGVWDALSYTTGRQTIVAKRDGMWITLEKASVFALKEPGIYGPDSYALEFDGNTVPAVIRMGVPVAGSYMEIEQYDMP